MVYPLTVRRRRRRRLLWTLAIGAAVVLIAVLVVQLRTERRRVGDYLEVAHSVAQTYKELATDVALIVTDVEGQERPTVLATMEEAVATAAEADRMLAEAPPPSASGAVGGFMAAASASWKDSLALFESTLTQLLDDPEDRARAALLEEVFLDMRVGDRAYARFLTAVGELDEDLVGFDFPEVSFVPAGSAIVYDGELLAGRIVAMAELSARHDIAVADISFLPQPVGDNQGVPVIPTGEGFEAQVTVINRGNEPEADVSFELLLLRLEGDASVASESRQIEALDPGQAQTLSFSELPVEQGVMYELVARAALTGDADAASNELRKVFIWGSSP